jgi:hypothetical protein
VITIKYNVTGTMDSKEMVDYAALQRQYEAALKEHKKHTDRYEDKLSISTKNRAIPLDPIYNATANSAASDLLKSERKFKDAVNLLLVDCLETVVKNDKEGAAEKFTLLNTYGPAAGFNDTQRAKMATFRAPTTNGGEK